MKNWFRKFLDLFKKPVVSEPITSLTQLNDIKQYDDVQVKIGESLYDGWVVERKENVVFIVYTDNAGKLIDTTFTITRPYNRNSLEQSGKTLILK
mgnify:FL=1